VSGRHGGPTRRPAVGLAIGLALAFGIAAFVVRGHHGTQDAAPGSPHTSSAAKATTSSGLSASPLPATPHPIPGFLLIADRGNDRMLLVDSQKHVLWRYPKPGVPAAQPFNFDDDTFFTPNWRAVISNQEDQETIQVISFPGGRLTWSYGHVGAAGSSLGFLHTPDDAYMLPNGIRTVADIHNCRILFISTAGKIVRHYGTTNVCKHDPPRYLSAPNGDTPIPGGGMIVTEINGSWVDGITASGKLMWAIQVPVSYPSDAQWLGHGKILLTDYSNPGRVLIMTTKGRVLFDYGPPSGPAALKYPSLALMLPNHLIAVNDDFRQRVVLIDPRTHRIVWQYGRTDVTGTGPGLLNTPDGMDFLPFDVAMRIPAIRALVSTHGG
jgi:hypothetical protein